jgi:hypothetical protein
MGYTHYWTQTRSFTDEEWSNVSGDIREILTYVENALGVPIAGGCGEGGTRPSFDAKHIMFNGLSDDSHETFTITRKRSKTWEGGTLGADFCKTARKPYDVAVTACLCYLASISETHSVSSDGNGPEFIDGLHAARNALPGKANMLDIPIDIMKDDRWTGPWVSGHMDSGFNVRFCVDGMGYVERGNSKEWYRFESHQALAQFLNANKFANFPRGGMTSFGRYPSHENDIWNASGSFDEARHKRIARAQAKVLRQLFPAPVEHAVPPPAFVRPGDMSRPEDVGQFCYSLAELMQKVA